jgi:hypothetical protein
MKRRTILLVILIVSVLSGVAVSTTAMQLPGTAAASTPPLPQTMRGGEYALTVHAPQGESALSGGQYHLRQVSLAAGASGCCCMSFLPCIRK